MSPTGSTSSTASQPAGQNAASAAPASSAGNSTVSKDMFLKLLVAQLRNQDPLSPADGVQFLTQLAQFTQLEQSVSMSTDLAAIRADLDRLAPQTGTENSSQLP